MKFELKKYNSSTLGGLLIHLFAAVCILVILVVIYFYVYLPKATNHGETITVPSIEGMHIEKVGDFLQDHDLRYEVNDSSYSAEHAPLTILKQIPSAGAKVKENRKIYVSVNRVTPPTVPLPPLIESSRINAEALLKNSELKRGEIIYVRGPFLNYVKEMKIEGVTVTPGTRVPKGTVVDLVVMDGGGRSFNTPDLIGQSFEDAKFLILGSNLNIGKITLSSDTTGTNAIVIKQNPEAEENIQVGDVVDLWLGQPDDEDIED
jgi:beta-lactam-binding protein with PASTA domain